MKKTILFIAVVLGTTVGLLWALLFTLTFGLWKCVIFECRNWSRN